MENLNNQPSTNILSRDIFSPRVNIKPYEYPELLDYVDAIRHSYWVHTEYNYDPDIQDMKVNLRPDESEVINRTMMAISQIESAVKTFWGKVHDHLPKPEIAKVGATFAESEVRHEDAYSHLLEKLGLNKRFEKINEIPALNDRLNYLTKINNKAKMSEDPKDYFEVIILFSMLIENVSLFSQFFIIMSFNKHKNVLKGMSNAIEATSKEEDIHAHFGFDIVNIIQDEHPDWMNSGVKIRIYDMAKKAFKAEQKVLDWIYEGSEVHAVTPRPVVEEFIKQRLNDSLKAIGLSGLFSVDEECGKEFKWFQDEISVTKSNDFFQKRQTTYTKGSQSFTAQDLF